MLIAVLMVTGCASSTQKLPSKPQEELLLPCDRLSILSAQAHMGDLMQWMDDARVKHQTCAAKHKALVESL